ncbi:MAG: AAA family ATPase [Cyclobacteriaceae bacterium]|nr:AAA family ATPase [Cyclobacteriaceae bacterium]
MHKISKLTLKNFKFFHGDIPINFERKNVLLYGENGSGKSSVYWGLYTFLQSVFKTDEAQVRKYFDVRHEQNLVNRFARENAESAIVVEFEDESQSVTKKQISLRTINTKVGGLIINCNQSSDFLNYKLLSKLYDFSNKSQIDLFPIFERDILMFINFDLEYRLIDGTVQNKNADSWWQYLKPGMNPRPRMHDPEYRIFSENINNFNREFKKYLFKIIETANDYVQKDFKQPFKLKLDYKDCTYDDFKNDGSTARNHITVAPQITLTVEFLHEKLVETKKDILRPQTFLNEARLTTIALSLRFAMLDEKYIEIAPKLLVLDDLLISLDMSNRDIVLELIINKFKKYQIIMMTHDRAFFNLMKKRIEIDKCSEDWITKEIYHSETDSGIPYPFIPDNKDYLDQAEKYLKEFDYPACANYLRKETERLLKRILPSNKILEVREDEPTRALQLDTLIDNFKSHFLQFDSDFTPFKKLKEHKDLLLNPLSHDNIDSPIYKQELVDIIAILKKLKLLEYKQIINITGAVENFIYLTETAADGELWRYKIQLKENLRAFKRLDGIWALNNPECVFVKRRKESDQTIEDLNRNAKLNHGHNNIRHRLGIADTPKVDIINNLSLKSAENEYSPIVI